MDISNVTEKNTKKRTIVIAMVLVILAIIIVFLSSRKNTATPPTAEPVSVEKAMPTEETMPVAMDDSMMGMESVRAVGAAAGTVATTDVLGDERVSTENTPEKRVRKTGHLSLRVNDLTGTVERIRDVAHTHGGDLMSARFAKYDDTTADVRFGTMTIRVVSNDFDVAMEEIKLIASIVQDESVATQDVTEQYIDTEAHLTNWKAQEEELRALLDRAEDVDDVLRVERELTRIRSEIDRLEGQLQYLRTQTDYATITVDLTEDAKVIVSDAWHPTQVAKDATSLLIKRSQALTNSLIALVISKLPFFILALIALWITYVIGNRIIAFMVRKRGVASDDETRT